MNDEILEAAARWHAAQHGDDMDWAGFTAWLEADPRHRLAFDQVALLDDDIALLRADAGASATDEDPRPSPAGRRRHTPWMAIGAAAACGALAVGVVSVRHQASALPDATWVAGPAPRAIAIADGASAVLGPGSSLHRDSADGRFRLAGRAFFSIRHDPARTVSIDAGAYRIRDVGTRFDLAEAGGTLEVQVAEGGVEVNAKDAGGSIRVNAGNGLIVPGAGAPAELRASSTAAVGNWRGGTFRYDDVPLAIVAADISRYTGRRIVLGAGAAGQRFSGVIVRGDRDAMIRTLGNLTGLDEKNEGDSVRLGSGDRSGRLPGPSRATDH